MGSSSTIEWTEATWNPVTGCSKISAGCLHCYAEVMARRLKAMGQPNYRNEFVPTIHEHMLEEPLKWKRPRMVFTNSMSDLFHKDVPESFIRRVFDVMGQAHWHHFQVLTKRSERLRSLNALLPWHNNIWMGVTVENADHLYRIDDLRSTDAHTKFLSIEPMLGPMPNLNLRGIDWVIVGGESGSQSRSLELYWVQDIRDQCIQSNTPFFFKQWGGRRKKKAGRELDGRIWGEMPAFQIAQ